MLIIAPLFSCQGINLSLISLKAFPVITHNRCEKKNNIGYLVFATVPSAAPELVSVQTLNSTSIQIEWLAVPEESIYGIPTRYTIYYANSDGKVYTKVVRPVNVQNTYQEVVSGLKESTEYSFQVSLSTAKGEGPLSVSKSSVTKGGCKWSKKYYFIAFVMLSMTKHFDSSRLKF